MIIDTIKNLGKSPTRRAMLDALKRTTYQGAARKYAVDATGRAAVHASYMYEGRDNKMLYIGTTAA